MNAENKGRKVQKLLRLCGLAFNFEPLRASAVNLYRALRISSTASGLTREEVSPKSCPR